MMEVLGGLGVDGGWCLGASRAAVCVVLFMLVAFFFFLRAIMPRRRVWAREQNLSRRVFATCLSWMTGVLLSPYVFGVLYFPLTSEEGRTLARAVAMSDAVSLRVVPA